MGEKSMNTRHESELESWVYVLYVGGTIGMVPNEDGALSPYPEILTKKLKEFWQLNDSAFASKFKKDNMQPLALAPSKGSRRILYTIRESEKLLDSSSMSMLDWMAIANDIKRNYESYDGFVVLHGTDTLCYTASALSFLLEDLGKTVVITGSMVPIFDIRSDGLTNFVSSLIIAGNYCIPEVTVFFGNKLFRGNRTIKISTSQENAFESPNMEPLATLGSSIEVNCRHIFRPCNIGRFTVATDMNPNVALLRLFPGISIDTVISFFKAPIEGVVLQTFGSGNIPSNRTDIIAAIEMASSRGVIIVNCTQCIHGTVSLDYESGEILQKTGILSGYDMTAEAALTKLAYVLAKNIPLEKKRALMISNLRGELTKPADEEKDAQSNDGADGVGKLGTKDVKEKFIVSAMLSAAYNGDIKSLMVWEKLGGDINRMDDKQRNVLHEACQFNHYDIVKYSLSKGANVHARDRYNKSPLDYAIKNNNHDIIRLLVSAGAHVRNKECPKLSKIICSATVNGDTETLISYIFAGLDLNCKNKAGDTPLHLAVEIKDVHLVKFLLSHHVRTDIKNAKDRTALSRMKSSNDPDMRELAAKLESNK